MFHRSERLFLRPAFPEDRDAIFTGIADQCVVSMLAKAPWPYTEEHARSWIDRKQDPLLPSLLVGLPGPRGEQVIGGAGLGLDEDGRVQLGYWLARPYWGHGYATEAARGVLAIARMLGHERLVAAHYLDNPASGRVLRKAGFRPTGRVEMRPCMARGRDVEGALYECLLGDEPAGRMRAA
jgi:RimJ/RimL family protein N-acetyltransferase